MFDAVAATLPASDLERARAFYSEKLGLEPNRKDEGGALRYEVGGAMLMVYQSEFAGSNRATAAGLAVADIEATVSELRGRGVAFEDYDFGEAKTVDGIVTLPSGARGAWFKDTEGNVVGLFQDA
jgi:predicted enzyme related to lactoylglutathione lyase